METPSGIVEHNESKRANERFADLRAIVLGETLATA